MLSFPYPPHLLISTPSVISHMFVLVLKTLRSRGVPVRPLGPSCFSGASQSCLSYNSKCQTQDFNIHILIWTRNKFTLLRAWWDSCSLFSTVENSLLSSPCLSSSPGSHTKGCCPIAMIPDWLSHLQGSNGSELFLGKRNINNVIKI